jgi:hypothetical protein
MTTASASTASRWDYTGDGATDTFPYDNKIFAATDMLVYLDGVLQSSGYSVTGAGTADGGNVVFTAAPDPDALVVLVRSVPATQQSDYVDGDDFPADTVEIDFDRAEIGIQQLIARLARTLRIDDFDTPDPLGALPVLADRASSRLGFGADGNPVAVTSDVTGVAATAFGTSLAEAVDAPTARSLLGLVIGTDVNAFMATVTQAAAEAGTATTRRAWTAERVAQAIAALAPATTTDVESFDSS